MVNEYIFVQLMNGLVLGMTLVLIAMGLSVIFGLMGIVNFAHGSLVLVGAYMTWWVWNLTGNFVLGLLIAPIVVGLLGLIIERVTLRPTKDLPPMFHLLLTFGIAEIIREGVQIIWGRAGHNIPIPPWGSGTIMLGSFEYPLYSVIIILVAIGLIAATFALLKKTDLGLVITAGSFDRDMIQILGVDVDNLFTTIFGFGALLAGVAGAMIGPLYSVSPTLGIDLLIPSFVVVIVGGMGSLRGTIVSGLIIGQLVVLSGIVVPSLNRAAMFIFLAIILLIRPQGLLGYQGVFES